jgi:hypothetical protein
MQGGRRGSAVKGSPDSFAIERDECPLGELCDGLRPGQKALVKTSGIQGDRILSCSREHSQEVVFVKAPEKSFLSQAYLA